MSIDILIPTYNRQKDLIKNIRHLNHLIAKDQLESYFRILVSDNCSKDDTWIELENIRPQIQVEMHLFKQNENIGLEKNAVFLLQQATSEYVMYIGDDDYLPENYFKYIIETIKKDNGVSAIVPGIEALFADGTTKIARRERFDFKKYPAGFWSALHVAYLGHQLSGILLKRAQLESNYLKNETYRNIYPFIYFLSYNALRGSVYYAPLFKVLVTQSNSKDWNYDDSGLLTEIFKNFNILYPHNPFRRFLLCCSVLKKQGGWRLRVGKQPLLAIKAILHVWSERQTDLLTKIGVLFLSPTFTPEKWHLFVSVVYRVIKMHSNFMPVPNLFIVGASKCGTTGLYHLLEKHDECCMSSVKEPHYFNSTEKTKDWYLSLFTACKGSSVIGEASPIYSETTYFPSVPGKIYEFNPSAKIVYMVRHPYEPPCPQRRGLNEG